MALTNKLLSGNYEYNNIVSLYDVARKPQTYGKVIKRYGDMLGLFNFLHLAGQTKDVTDRSLTIIEEGAPEKSVRVAIAADAVAPITNVALTVNALDEPYLRPGFDLIVPAKYTNKTTPVALRLIEATAGVWTATAYDVTATIPNPVAECEMMIGASSWGYGTGQPEGMATGYFTRTTGTRIMKETFGIEGGQIFQADWEEVELENGTRGIFSRAIAEMDFRLDSQLDAFLLLGEANTNTTNLVATSDFSASSVAIPSADGMIKTMAALGQELPWSTAFDEDKFEAVKPLLEAVGVSNRNIDFFVGSGLNTQIYLSMRDFLTAYSMGHTFYDQASQVGFNVNKVMMNSVNFNIIELSSLANPAKYGIADYGLGNYGFMFPQGEHKVSFMSGGVKEDLRLPHLTIGYPVGKGENRRRTIVPSPGVTNMYPVATNDKDGLRYYALTEIMPIWVYMQQTILVRNTGDSGTGA